MRLLCDVYDAAGTRLGAGPVQTLQSVSVQRVLDGAGTITFSTPTSDARALELLTVRRRVRIYAETLDTVREIARGVILQRRFTENASGASYTFTCADNLEELKYVNTLLGRAYKQARLDTTINSLMALVTGWTATVESGVAGKLLEARFDGASVLKALQQITTNIGVHFRLGEGNVLEVGAFGGAASISAMNTATTNAELYANLDVAVIDRIEAGDDAENIVNTVIPLGAGEGVAALTLKRSTRTSPYAIKSATGPDGRTYWYLEDAASVAAYGRVWGVALFKDIAPITNAKADRINAANALYDAAAAYLARAGVIQKSYKLTLRGVKRTLRPGQKINVRYRGSVTRSGEVIDYVDINEDFWILKVSEVVGESGQTVQLEVNNVDTTTVTTEQALIEAMEAVELRGLKPGAGANCRSFVYSREIAPGFPAVIPVEITNATQELIRLRVRIRTSPFRATSRAASHRHKMFFFNGTVSFTPTTWRGFAATNEYGTLNRLFVVGDTTGQATEDLYTYGEAGGTEYVIQDDIEYPRSISVFVNGKNRTNALGGPFATGGSALDVVLDVGKMTGYIEAAETFEQIHTVELRCSAGQGRIEAVVEIYEVTQDIDVS